MPSSPDPARTDRLADVYERADRLRRRRRRRTAGAAVLASAALLVAGLVVAAVPEDASEVVAVGSPAPTGSAPDATSTTESEGAGGEGEAVRPAGPTTTSTVGHRDESREADATTTTAAPTTTSTTATTSAGPCRNSHDPACGPFRYDPEPDDRPMRVTASAAPTTVLAGEEVTFTVRVADDGPVHPGSCTNTQDYGDGSATAVCTAACAPPEPGEERYGPWDPPPPQPTAFEEEFRHTYGEPGTYTATFAYNVGSDCSDSPYRSRGEATVTITVL